MAQDSWNAAHVHTFDYNGGVTELITPDNLKTGVTKPDLYDPEINKSYAELALHYSTAILPARPARPTDKPSTENSVKFIETWVIAYLRDMKFFSLAELNAAIFKRVDEINSQSLKRSDLSRNDIFEAEEKPFLIPLPGTPYERSEWRKAKVGIDYCIQVDRQRYSVPYQLVAQELDVRLSAAVVEVFKDGERVCSHERAYGRYYQSRVKDEHMPEAHRLYAEEWNPKRFSDWAASVGPACLDVIQTVLASKPHPALAYRSCMGILSFARSKGNTFLEDVCKVALATSKKPSYSQIKALARSAVAKAAEKSMTPDKTNKSIGSAGMVRGSDYYRLD
jgi:transposase